MTTEISCDQIEKTGRCCTPGKSDNRDDTVSADIPVHFESDSNHRVKIKTDQGLYQVAGITKDNFPEMPAFTNEKTIEIQNSTLNRMFRKTLFAVSSEELRPALMGVFMQIMSDELRMVATDGHRLSKIVDNIQV